MKKLFLYVFLGLMWCNNVFADKLPITLFNIGLYDNIEKYTDKENGKEYEVFPNSIVFIDDEKNKLKGITRHKDFESFYARTDENYKILDISGIRGNSIYTKYFENRCLSYREELVKTLSQLYEINPNEFKNKYYKFIYDGDETFLVQTSELNFFKQFKRMKILISCSYYLRDSIYKDAGKEVIWRLTLSLMDKKFFEETTLNLWESIKPFDNDFIISDISGF